MKLLRLERSLWDVTAVIEESNDGECCPLTDFLADIGAQHPGTANGMYDLFERFSVSGKENFSDDLCHYADKNEKIWQFTKGRLRVLWFYGQGNRIVVCSHGFLKQSQKTPKKEINRAISTKKQYEVAVKINAVTIQEEEDDH
jgi:hypothetical protein